jgi:hypothetical protein
MDVEEKYMSHRPKRNRKMRVIDESVEFEDERMDDEDYE